MISEAQDTQQDSDHQRIYQVFSIWLLYCLIIYYFLGSQWHWRSNKVYFRENGQKILTEETEGKMEPAYSKLICWGTAAVRAFYTRNISANLHLV